MNIFEIQRSRITRDLSSKSFLFYGPPKTGKTSNAVKFPKAFLMGFEKGWNWLDNVAALPIDSWVTALDCKKQLLKQAKEVQKAKDNGDDTAELFYQTIIIDTGNIAYNFCEKFILDKEGVEYIDETEKMRGYKAVAIEFENFFQELVKAGYTLVVLCHSETKQYKINGVKFEKTQPKIDKRGLAVLAGLCDIIGYAHPVTTENGEKNMMLTLRGDEELEAGSRSKYMAAEIPFTYEALFNEVQRAIDLEAKNGAVIEEGPTQVYKDQYEKRNYKELQAEITELCKKISKEASREEATLIIEKTLGRDTEDHPRKVSDTTANQTDLLIVILRDLQDKAEELGIK